MADPARLLLADVETGVGETHGDQAAVCKGDKASVTSARSALHLFPGGRSTCQVQGFGQPQQSDVVGLAVLVVALVDQDAAHEARRSKQRPQRIRRDGVDGPGCGAGLPAGQKHRRGSGNLWTHSWIGTGGARRSPGHTARCRHQPVGGDNRPAATVGTSQLQADLPRPRPPAGVHTSAAI